MSNDLSEVHEPIGTLFPRLANAAAVDGFALTEDQVAQFHEDGYVAGIRVLEPEQIDALRDELAELSSPDAPGHDRFYEFNSNESDDPETVLFHALGAWRVGPAFHDMLWNPRFTVPASQLLDGPVRFWHDQLFCKPPRHGGVVAWHQDYSYWTRTKPMAHLTCWIGLDDATCDSGCLQYIPGSHRWDLLPITGLAGKMDAINQVLSAEQREQWKPVAIELKAGEAAIHHPLLVHGSTENRTDRPRRAAVINVIRDGVCSDADESLLCGVPVIPKGQPMGGQFFPLLYDPAHHS